MQVCVVNIQKNFAILSNITCNFKQNTNTPRGKIFTNDTVYQINNSKGNDR